MANKFSFEESEITAIISLYQKTIENTANETHTFIQEVEKICEDTKYEPIVALRNKCASFYMIDVQGSVEKFFEEWAEGEASVSAFIRGMNGGEDAENTARYLESGLRDAIPEMFRQVDTEYTTDTSHPVVEEQNFEELKEATTNYKGKLEEIMSEAVQQVSTEKDDNGIYACIEAPIKSTLEVVLSAFENIANEYDAIKEDFTSRSSNLDSIAGDTAASVESAAQTEGQNAFDELKVSFHL